ncbi:respiratory nitrate reductase subunit gamma, partial [Aeromonas veronii]|uniref:respiratory nitrate reductase subunit gamma n=2 Tax=Aeromonadaceae TaxID=84642 RepID=UPI00342726A9
GHFFGLLTPHWVYESFLSLQAKQLIAMSAGGVFGAMTLYGGYLLLKRRLTNARIRATSSTADILILVLLVSQAALGLLTIPFSAFHLDGSIMMKLVSWAQDVVTFQTGASNNLEGVSVIYKIHMVLGMTLFVVFPFCRLVHVWSVPLEYLTRRIQIVRSRR